MYRSLVIEKENHRADGVVEGVVHSIGESSKMLGPDPSNLNLIRWIILILCQPKLALLTNHIKYLQKDLVSYLNTRHDDTYLAGLVGQVRVDSLSLGIGNVKLKQRSSEIQYVVAVTSTTIIIFIGGD